MYCLISQTNDSEMVLFCESNDSTFLVNKKRFRDVLFIETKGKCDQCSLIHKQFL